MKNNNILLSGLYLVATPIGNLKDFSLRAIEVLKDVDVIACEDTRTSAVLLRHYDIRKPLISYHDHNSMAMTPKIITRIKAGEKIALISDAGTPLVSDPGYKLVSACREAGLYVTSIPGPVAFITALQLSGLSPDTFSFLGFLPNKKTARREILGRLGREKATTVIFYESPNRLLKALEDIREILGDVRVCVSRELTKKFEEVTTDRVSKVMEHYNGKESIKGEIVLLLEIKEVGREITDGEIKSYVEELLEKGLSRRDAAAATAEHLGVSKKRVYDVTIKT